MRAFEISGKVMNKIIAEVFLVAGMTCAGLLLGLELLEIDNMQLSFSGVASGIGLFCIGSILTYLFSRNN
jgi:hypothetical protein